MAKCITNGKVVKRVPNQEAKRLVDEGKWKYAPKSDYRRSITDKEEKE